MTTVAFVHGACVRDGAWWWERMVAPLAAHGIASATVALPSCGEGGGELGDLPADAAACVAAIERADGPVVLIGHSYGGMVVTDAGPHPQVAGLVYLTSVMAAEGESQGELLAGAPAPWMDPGEDGTVGVRPELIEELFLQDCDAEATRGALERLTRQSVVPFGQAARQIAWRERPSTYVVCAQDLATPPEAQRERARAATRVVEIEAGHHPFLSRPQELAALLAGEVRRMT